MIRQARFVSFLYVVLIISLSFFLYIYHISIKQKFQHAVEEIEVPVVKIVRSDSLSKTDSSFRGTAMRTDRSTLYKTTIVPINTTKTTKNISRQNHEQKRMHGNATSVLLLTYLRSGSTFTADLLQQAPGTFYVYEPMKKMLPNGYYLKSGQECFYLEYPEVCRNSTQFDSFIDMITAFYDCDFSPTFLLPERHSDAQIKVKECLHESQKNASICNRSMRSLCEASAVRMIKTIRLSMDVVELLLKRIPTLKVVHLIRDPRGMHKSRRKGGFLKRYKSRSHDAINACSRYLYDLNVAERLNSTYPSRIKKILFEDLALDTTKYAKDLYNFLDLSFPPDMFDWISNHTSSNQKDGYYGTVRVNSSAVVSEWKEKLSHELIKEIDDACEAVYNITGYTSYYP